MIRIPHYVHALKAGEVNPTPSIKTEMETPTIARIDGDKGFGQVVARHGITLGIAKARAQGLSAVTLRRTNHVGRLADYAEMAAVQGLIGMLWVNAPTALNVRAVGRRRPAPRHQPARGGGAGAQRDRRDVARLRDERRRRGQAEGQVQPRARRWRRASCATAVASPRPIRASTTPTRPAR